MTLIKRKLRLLVVGAKFGETYLNAFLCPNPDVELVGLLSTGSERSKKLAHSFGISLYTDISQVPQDIDIACVVVRSTVVGGDGTTLVEELLKRGIHIIQEHPVHSDDIIKLQDLAKKNKCIYWVNSCYAHTPAGKSWINNAKHIIENLNEGSPSFVNFTTSRQLLYSSLDLLLQGCKEREVDIRVVENENPLFSLINLNFPDFTATLRLQKYMDPREPDFHSLVMHKLTVGWTSGYLSLESSYGPVLWTSSLYDEEHNYTDESFYSRNNKKSKNFLSGPITTTLYSPPASWGEAFEIDNAKGVKEVLNLLVAHLNGDDIPDIFDESYQVFLSDLWQKILREADLVNEREMPKPRTINPNNLLYK
jgi:thiazolinyl reductase component of yersiniabactin synthetase